MFSRYFLIVIVLFVGLATTYSAYERPLSEPCGGRCNIILIIVDTLAATHMDDYGYERTTMPRTSKFFATGAVFESAQSVSPWTLPSFASMYFSDLPHKITYQDLAGNGVPSYIAQLRAAGYAIGRSNFGTSTFIHSAVYAPFKPSEINQRDLLHVIAKGPVPHRLFAQYATSGKPFFFTLHTFQAHDPYNPTDAYAELFHATTSWPVVTMQDLIDTNKATQTVAAHSSAFALRYDQKLRAVDDAIADFLEGLPQELLDTTVIILTADHGEAFGEHDRVWHAQSLFQEEVHVPLYIRGPSIKAARITEPVSLLDLAPTILSYAATEQPEAYTGINLRTVLETGKTPPRRLLPMIDGDPYFFSITPDMKPSDAPKDLHVAGAWDTERSIVELQSQAFRYGPYVFLTNNGQRSIFNLTTDPTQKMNLLDDENLAQSPVDPELSDFIDLLENKGIKVRS